MTHALSGLATLGAELRELELPIPTDRTLQSAESYIFHAEFVARSSELYQPETLRRIRTGENVSPEKLLQGRQELIRARRDIAAVFTDVDLLVTPTTPIPAPAIAELKQNPDILRPRELLLLRNTRPINVWGLPAISIPCGFTPAGSTHRPADHRTTLGRGQGPAIGSRLRASDSLAQAQPPVILSGALRFANAKATRSRRTPIPCKNSCCVTSCPKLCRNPHSRSQTRPATLRSARQIN